MYYRNARHLQIGDRVEFCDSNVHANGVVVEDLGPDYVRVQWFDCRLATTHRRHALGFLSATPDPEESGQMSIRLGVCSIQSSGNATFTEASTADFSM
jgi:hypothetical protein